MPATQTKSSKLKEARIKLKVDGKKLQPMVIAYKIGVTTQTIYNWENGATCPRMRMDQFVAYAEILGLSLEELQNAINESYKGDDITFVQA